MAAANKPKPPATPPPPAQQQPRCETCAAWEAQTKTCYRYPPVVTVVRLKNGQVAAHQTRPQTQPTDWCLDCIEK